MPKICEMIGKKEKSFKPDGSRWPQLIGIELELENVDNVPAIPYWDVKPDNSLRNGVEYVLDNPYGGPTLESAVDSYYKANVQANNSARTSTHVHINVLDTDFDAVRAMIMIVYMIEEALYNVVEGDRKWAGYSMPLSEMNSTRLRTVLSAPWPEHGNKILSNLAPTKNQERYYGFNFAAAKKYGTVEFRYFPGGPTREELESWIDLIVAIKQAALTVGSPAALIDRLNNDQNVVEFLDEFLPGSWSNTLLKQASADSMLEKFNEVAALCTDFVMDRRDAMVFITPSLMKFIGTKVLVKEGLTYLEKLRPLGVLTADEWDYHYDKAARLERGAKNNDFDEIEPLRIKRGDYARPALRAEPAEEDVDADWAPAAAGWATIPVEAGLNITNRFAAAQQQNNLGTIAQQVHADNPTQFRYTEFGNENAPAPVVMPPDQATRTRERIRQLETESSIIRDLWRRANREHNNGEMDRYNRQYLDKQRQITQLRRELPNNPPNL